MLTKFWSENLKGRMTWKTKDLGVDGKVMLEWILGEWRGEMWTGCTWLRIRDQWQALVNTVMNLEVP